MILIQASKLQLRFDIRRGLLVSELNDLFANIIDDNGRLPENSVEWPNQAWQILHMINGFLISMLDPCDNVAVPRRGQAREQTFDFSKGSSWNMPFEHPSDSPCLARNAIFKPLLVSTPAKITRVPQDRSCPPRGVLVQGWESEWSWWWGFP